MPPRDVCYPYTYDYSWMYSFATKRTVTHPMAKYGPPPRSLVGSPASWAGELEGDRAHPEITPVRKAILVSIRNTF